MAIVQTGVEGQPGAREAEHHRTDDHEHAFVESVAQSAAPEGADDEEGQLDEAGEADPETRMRLAVHLEGNGDDGEITAE